MNNDELIYNYETDCKLRTLAGSTIEFNVGEVDRFCRYLKNKSLEEVDKQDLLAYLSFQRQKNLKFASIERIFAGLASFYDYLLEMEYIIKNPVRSIQKRYLRQYKEPQAERRALSIDEASKLINSIIDTRDKAILILLFKTGMRAKELVELDISDINIEEMTATIKPTAKRSNRTVFFDDETRDLLARWLRTREAWPHMKNQALFITRAGARIRRDYLLQRVEHHAQKIGLHDPSSKDPARRFSPHYCRHAFTTWLRKAGMPREMIQELRGDVRREAIDIYDHIDKTELKESYLNHMPMIGV